jgi:ubiquinone/menaquinone biosynthesis C-methylase UbiE
MAALSYGDAAAAGYDEQMSRVTRGFAPFLLTAARLRPGHRVLDIATGTGLAAEAALAAVGPAGHVVAADIAPAMLAKARARLGRHANVSFAVEDGQALSFPQGCFDSVLCSLGLMFFPAPELGLAEFHRVLRPGGRAAVSVATTVERSFNGQIIAIIGRYVPSLADAAERFFSLGGESKLRTLLEKAGFADVEVATASLSFTFPSFDAYFEPYERGGGAGGQAYIALPDKLRRTVRDEVRCCFGGTDGPIQVPADIRIGSGRRQEPAA